MRLRWWLCLTGLLSLGLAVIVSPLRHILFPKPMTTDQQWIVRRAELGLKHYASKSPTAARLYREATMPASRPKLTVTAKQPDSSVNGATFTLVVAPENPLSWVAMYVHTLRAVYFFEPSCNAMSYTALGLVYAHELQHRVDCLRGKLGLHDLLTGPAMKESEARAQLVEIRILDEFTEGRWNEAVDRHNAAHDQLPRRDREHLPAHQCLFTEDQQWMIHEFGWMPAKDKGILQANFKFTAGFRTLTKGQDCSSADSLRIAAEVRSTL